MGFWKPSLWLHLTWQFLSNSECEIYAYFSSSNIVKDGFYQDLKTVVALTPAWWVNDSKVNIYMYMYKRHNAAIGKSSPKYNDRSLESNVPRSTCPNTLCSLSLTPMMLHIKFDQDWPTGFRDIQVQMCEIFITQGQVTPKWVVWFCPKSNLTEL